MPEIQVNIGGRSFDVACAQGEEAHLQKAAKMIDTETEILASIWAACQKPGCC